MAIEYRYELEESGQAWVEVGRPGEALRVVLHDPTDGLREMAEATWLLARGQYRHLPEGKAENRLFWEAEGREYRWEFLRRNWVELEVSLYRSPKTSTGSGAEGAALEEAEGEERVFYCECTVPDLARVVLAQLARTLVRYGFVSFRELHVYERFPVSLLLRLRNYLLEQEAGAVPVALRERNASSLREEVDYLYELLEPGAGRSSVRKAPALGRSAPTSAAGEGLQLRFQLRDAGWADAWISAGGSELHFRPGYLTHALGELSHAAVRLLDPRARRFPGEGEVPEIRWEGEPQRLRWELHPLDPDRVDVRVFYTGNAYDWDPELGRLPVTEKRVLRTQVSPADFGLLVLTQLEQVLLKHGLLGYRECWIDSEFPLSDYLKLHGLLADRGEHSRDYASGGALRRELDVLSQLLRTPPLPGER